MRLFRVVCCALALASLAAAQTSSSGNSAQVPSPQQTGQPPQNPIQEATQSGSLAQQQQQQEQKQAEAARSKPATFDIGAAASGVQDQELGEARLMTRYSQINGSPQGVARSFHNPGENDLAEFNYFLDKKLFGTGHRRRACRRHSYVFTAEPAQLR